MRDKSSISHDSWLTVKEAAELTNLSVPTFYTPQRKKDFGYDEKSGDVWMIPVQLLINHGLLTPDLEPVRPVRSSSKIEAAQLESMAAEIRKLNQELGELRTANAVMAALIEEKDKQLEMLKRFLDNPNKPQSD